MKTYGGIRYVSTILVPTAVPPTKEIPVSIGEEAGWAPEAVWTLW
jgi:hypothetical protein